MCFRYCTPKTTAQQGMLQRAFRRHLHKIHCASRESVRGDTCVPQDVVKWSEFEPRKLITATCGYAIKCKGRHETVRKHGPLHLHSWLRRQQEETLSPGGRMGSFKICEERIVTAGIWEVYGLRLSRTLLGSLYAEQHRTANIVVQHRCDCTALCIFPLCTGLGFFISYIIHSLLQWFQSQYRTLTPKKRKKVKTYKDRYTPVAQYPEHGIDILKPPTFHRFQ